jgi:hypothetical protein
MLGEFNAEDFADDGFLTRIYFLSFQALGIFIVVNFFVSVLADGVFIMTTEMNGDEHVQYDLWEYIWSRTLDLVGIGKKVAVPTAIVRNIKVLDSATTDLDVKLSEMVLRLSEISNHMGVKKSVAVVDRSVMRARVWANYAKGMHHFRRPVVPQRVIPRVGQWQAVPRSMPSFKRGIRGALPPAPPPKGSVLNAKGCLAPSATI